MIYLIVGLIGGFLAGFAIGHIHNITSYYNGSIRMTDYGVDLDIVDAKKLDKQKYLILSVRNDTSHK